MSLPANPVTIPYDIIAKYSPENGHAEITDSPHTLYFRTCPEVSQQIREFLLSRGWLDISYAQLHPHDFPVMLPGDLIDQVSTLLKKGTSTQKMQILKQFQAQAQSDVKDFLARQPIINGHKPTLCSKRSINIPRNPQYYKMVPNIWSLWWEDQGFNPINVPLLSPSHGWNHIFSVSANFRKDGLQHSMGYLKHVAGSTFNGVIPGGWVLPTENVAWNQHLITLIKKYTTFNLLFANGDEFGQCIVQMDDNADVTPDHTQPPEKQDESAENTIYVKYDEQGMINFYSNKLCTHNIPLPPQVLAHNTWIAKPSGGARGEGIFVFTDLNKVNARIAHLCKRKKEFFHEAKKTVLGQQTLSRENHPANRLFTGTLTVQEYLNTNMLLGNPQYKFDLRLYVLITSHYPLEIYLHDRGLVRIASLPFENDITQTHAHLTNYSVGKKTIKPKKCSQIDDSNSELQSAQDTSHEPPQHEQSAAYIADDADDNATISIEQTLRPPSHYDNLDCDKFDAATTYSNNLKWTLDEFEEYINKRKAECDAKGIPMKSYDQIWCDIKHIILKALMPTIPSQCYAPKTGPFDKTSNSFVPQKFDQTCDETKTVWESITEHALSDYNPSYRGYELLGVDVMLHNDGEPLLIEMNRSPAMVVQTTADYAKTQVLHDVFNMLNIEPSLLAAKRNKFLQQMNEPLTTLRTDGKITSKNLFVPKSLLATITKKQEQNTTQSSLPDTTTEHPALQNNVTEQKKEEATQELPTQELQAQEKREPYYLDVNGVKIRYPWKNLTCVSWMKYRPEYHLIANYIDSTNRELLRSNKNNKRFDEIIDDNKMNGKPTMTDVIDDFCTSGIDILAYLNTNISSKMKKLQKNSKFQKQQTLGKYSLKLIQDKLQNEKTTTNTQTEPVGPSDETIIEDDVPKVYPFCAPHRFQRIFPLNINNYLANYAEYRYVLQNHLTSRMEQLSSQLLPHLHKPIKPLLTKQQEDISKQSNTEDNVDIILLLQEYYVITYSIRHVDQVIENYLLKLGICENKKNEQVVDNFMFTNVNTAMLFDPTTLFSSLKEPSTLVTINPVNVAQNDFNPKKHIDSRTSLNALIKMILITTAQSQYWVNCATNPIPEHLLANVVSFTEDITLLDIKCQDNDTFNAQEMISPTAITSINLITSKNFDMRISRAKHNVNQYIYIIARALMWYKSVTSPNSLLEQIIPQSSD